MAPRSSIVLNSNLRWFLFTMIVANIAGEMVYGLLSLYLLQLGASITQVGIVFTVAAIVPIVLQILGGWLADVIGRLKVIAYGSIIAVMSYLFFLVAPSWEWVLIGLCVDYVSIAVVGPGFNAYVAEQSTEEERGAAFGLSQSIYTTVMVVGPIIGGFMAYHLGFRPMISVALILYTIATGLRIWMARTERFEVKRSSEKPTLALFKSQVSPMIMLIFAGSVLTWIWITDAISDMAYYTVDSLYPVYLSRIGNANLSEVGILNAMWGVAMIASSFVAGHQINRYGERKLIVVGFALEASGLFLMTQVHDFASFLITTIVYGLGTGCLAPAFESLISKVVPSKNQGLAFGFFGTSLGILSLPFPWIGAQLWEHVAPQAPFAVVVVTCIVSMAIAWFKFALPKEKTNP